MFRRSSHGLALPLLMIGLWIAASPAMAQPAGQYVYSVDYLCGYQASDRGVDGYEPLVKVANYASKVDIYNPDPVFPASLTAEIIDTTGRRWALATTGTAMQNLSLPASEATLLDCVNVLSTLMGTPLPTGKPFHSGMIVVRSNLPLVVWATKTTQVCASLVTVDDRSLPDPVLRVGPDGQPLPDSGGIAPPPPRPSLLGCPVATVDNGFLMPGEGVDGFKPPSFISGDDGSLEVVDVSISHSIDSERVDGLFLSAP